MINIKPISGTRNRLQLIDQTRLPVEELIVNLTQLEEVADAIKRLVVRGAPAIGIAAAYGLSLHIESASSVKNLKEKFDKAFDVLAATRPTAVNLFWALNRMQTKLDDILSQDKDLEAIKVSLFNEAESIEREDYAMCRKIGEYGIEVFKGKSNFKAMTICNAGGLATAGYGTALACFYMAKEKGMEPEVFALETRPLLQGSRLTAYELLKAGIKTTLLSDNMSASLMREKQIDCIITGADRIAKNGDAANKIGTYQLAILAKAHDIPFYVAAPATTFDFKLEKGEDIPIEFRGKDELIHFGERQTAPSEVEVYAPAFDVTPAQLISGIITNQGLFRPPYHFDETILQQ